LFAFASGTGAVKAMDWPSFDQWNVSMRAPCAVRGQASPPPGEMSQIWRASGFSAVSFSSLASGSFNAVTPSRSVRKAIQRPSGDHSAFVAGFLPRVSWTDLPEATSARKSWVT
jgi:hypothetical protein